MDLARRSLLRGRQANTELRPPWLRSPGTFTGECTRCGHCIEACPETILHPGDGGFPAVDFSRGECTFCGECTRYCEPGLFYQSLDEQQCGWTHKAQVGESCLTYYGIMCRSCEDACEPAAITFPLRAGKIPSPQLNIEACTGCGACIAPCPESVITMAQGESS